MRIMVVLCMLVFSIHLAAAERQYVGQKLLTANEKLRGLQRALAPTLTLTGNAETTVVTSDGKTGDATESGALEKCHNKCSAEDHRDHATTRAMHLGSCKEACEAKFGMQAPVQEGPCDPTPVVSPAPQDGFTALHLAAKMGNHTATEKLMGYAEDLKAKASDAKDGSAPAPAPEPEQAFR